MAILAAAVAVLGVLYVVNLLFTVGVIRRLREHTELLATLRAVLPGEPQLAAPGTRIPGFAAAGVAGDPVDLDAPETLVGFFSPDCGPCADLLPRFVEHAAGAGGPVLAVVVGDGAEATGMLAELQPVAQVVREDRSGTVATAFGVSSFPSLFVLGGDRTVMASGHDLTALRVPAAAGRPRG